MHCLPLLSHCKLWVALWASERVWLL
jgi:hypothetical protein